MVDRPAQRSVTVMCCVDMCPAGVVFNVLFLSWLYAYYCFDYKWALEGIRLPNRLHFFECNWAYFAGEQRAATSTQATACSMGLRGTSKRLNSCCFGSMCAIVRRCTQSRCCCSRPALLSPAACSVLPGTCCVLSPARLWVPVCGGHNLLAVPRGCSSGQPAVPSLHHGCMRGEARGRKRWVLAALLWRCTHARTSTNPAPGC